jgi:mediator of RNA polymerase II transcription subunit 12
LPDSVNSDKEEEPLLGSGFAAINSNSTNPQPTTQQNAPDLTKNLTQRHFLYTTHFPLPQDESSQHDCNQRHVLLYGVGKHRDEARHAVKKVTKEILKLFNRKSSMDICEGGKIKKPVIKDGFSFESALNRFQSLSYFDQHVVTGACAAACMEMFNGVAAGSSNHLPLIESVAFLFDLMEIALNIHGLLEFCVQLLKELPEVEQQLQQCAPLVSYCSTIQLYVIGLLYRYHACVLLTEQAPVVFELCMRLSSTISNLSDCSSTDRCLLVYIHDLYQSCTILRVRAWEGLSSQLNKIECTVLSSKPPTASLAGPLNINILADQLANPKQRPEPAMFKQLVESANIRHSFVANALRAILTTAEMNRVNELSILCTEYTAHCSELSSDWLALFTALCCSSNRTLAFNDVILNYDLRENGLQENLGVFISILIARNCFAIQDFIVHCALPSLLAACQATATDTQVGARLTCHLLLCLFRTLDPPLSAATVCVTPATTLYSLRSPAAGTPGGTPQPAATTLSIHGRYVLKHPCDRYLLVAARNHQKIETPAVLAVLKAVLMLGDVSDDKDSNKMDTGAGNKTPSSSNNKELAFGDMLGNLEDSEFGDFGLSNSKRLDTGSGFLEPLSLSDVAKHTLRQISSENWVYERCLKEPERLIDKEYLLDSMLSHRQAQQLLQMICNPKQASSANNTPGPTSTGPTPETESELRAQISRILNNLDEWRMRVSWVQLQLMYAQCSVLQSTVDVSTWLDCVARSTLDFFGAAAAAEEAKSRELLGHAGTGNGCSGSSNSKQNKSGYRGSGKRAGANSLSANGANDVQPDGLDSRVWLVAPLILKLPNAVQGRILKVVASQLESGNWMTVLLAGQQNGSKSKDRGFQQAKGGLSVGGSVGPLGAAQLLHYPPFRALLFKCMRGQGDQRDTFLSALYAQLQCCVHEESRGQFVLQPAIQLRLALVGCMFDQIQRCGLLLSEWSMLLLQLLTYGVVSPQLNYSLYTGVIDMLAALVHSTLVDSGTDAREDSRKQHQNLMKKLRKEVNYDRVDISMSAVRQLLPPGKQNCEIITCEPMGSLIDTKGNKIAGFDSIDKKQGLQVAEKQRLSPWDLVEGCKNSTPLCWSWFGTLKIERKPLRIEENYNLLPWHEHSIRKPLEYYLEDPPVPAEDTFDQQPMEVDAGSPEPVVIVPSQLSGCNDGPLNTMPLKNLTAAAAAAAAVNAPQSATSMAVTAAPSTPAAASRSLVSNSIISQGNLNNITSNSLVAPSPVMQQNSIGNTSTNGPSISSLASQMPNSSPLLSQTLSAPTPIQSGGKPSGQMLSSAVGGSLMNHMSSVSIPARPHSTQMPNLDLSSSNNSTSSMMSHSNLGSSQMSSHSQAPMMSTPTTSNPPVSMMSVISGNPNNMQMHSGSNLPPPTSMSMMVDEQHMIKREMIPQSVQQNISQPIEPVRPPPKKPKQQRKRRQPKNAAVATPQVIPTHPTGQQQPMMNQMSSSIGQPMNNQAIPGQPMGSQMGPQMSGQPMPGQQIPGSTQLRMAQGNQMEFAYNTPNNQNNTWFGNQNGPPGPTGSVGTGQPTGLAQQLGQGIAQNRMPQQINQQQLNPNQINAQMQNQMGNQMGPQMGQQMSTPMQQQMQQQIPPQMGQPINAQLNVQMNSQLGGQMNAQMNPQMSGQMNQQMNPHLNAQVNQQLVQPVGMQQSGMQVNQQAYYSSNAGGPGGAPMQQPSAQRPMNNTKAMITHLLRAKNPSAAVTNAVPAGTQQPVVGPQGQVTQNPGQPGQPMVNQAQNAQQQQAQQQFMYQRQPMMMNQPMAQNAQQQQRPVRPPQTMNPLYNQQMHAQANGAAPNASQQAGYTGQPGVYGANSQINQQMNQPMDAGQPMGAQPQFLQQQNNPMLNQQLRTGQMQQQQQQFMQQR